MKISKISDFFDMFDFFNIYRALAHILLKLYEIYYEIILCVFVCVCASHIRWSTLVIHTALQWRGAIWQKLSNTEKMLRAQVISQQNTQTENQNIVTMCHIKFFLNSIKIENIKKNIRQFRTKISDIYQWYISAIYIKPTLSTSQLVKKVDRSNTLLIHIILTCY